MNRRLPLTPEDLGESVLRQLADHANRTTQNHPEDLLAQVRDHLANIRAAAAADNPFINIRLAEGIADRFHAVALRWDRIPGHAEPWMKAAMAYFVATADEVPDFESPIGFEDDCEVLNACLRFAERDDLCLDPADFDDF